MAREGRQRESWLKRILGRLTARTGGLDREGLEDALDRVGSVDDFTPEERAMLRNVLALKTLRVSDVMVPRADIVAMPLDSTLGEALRIFRTAGHSRLPVHGETLDDPRGMVHIRDFIDYLAAKAETGSRRRKAPSDQDLPNLGKVDLAQSMAAAKILRPVLYVPPSMPAVDLLRSMQATRTHMALVIDEYGGTDGLVSIEDLVEMIVGDIEDEHDEAEIAIRAEDGGRFVANGRATLEEVSQAVGLDLSQGEQAEDVDTIGGLIVTLVGRVPARGEVVAGPDGLELEILDADPRRVNRVRIHPKRDPQSKASHLHAQKPDGQPGTSKENSA